jgi:tRNA threonylcarbamoyladenosine biosynthesis protein TsaE
MTITSLSSERTLEIGAALAGVLRPDDVLCLEGELGTGKTVIVRGIARALGHEGPVTSPTFMLIHPYPEIDLCHVDAFRLEGAEEMLEAGIEEYCEGGWICAVEWAERVRGALPPGALSIKIAFGRGDDDRVITLDAQGGWNGRLEALMELLQ